MIRFMRGTVRRALAAIVIFFVLPVLGAAAWWTTVDRPGSWRHADWNSSGMIANPGNDTDARIMVLAARTGGFKGAFAVHSWLLVKREGESTFTRYDKVGWGSPIRVNGYAPDARWYSNDPFVVADISGSKAAELMDDVERAIESYPFSNRGDYTIWPGPNSNTFIAHVLRQVPELDAELPPNAVGRDFPTSGWVYREADGSDLHVTLGGYAGFSVGRTTGFEIHLLGQAIGIDWADGAVKLPAFGRISPSS